MNALLFLFFFASGASGLIYEIVWVRQLGFLFGSTVYSAALVSGIYMSGLGFGGWLAGRWADARFARGAALPLRAYGACEIAIALWALALVPGIPGLAELAAHASSYVAGEHGWRWLGAAGSVVRYGCAALALVPVTLVMGATLTLLIRHRVRDDLASAGWQIGALYAVNTAGAALGCLLTDTALVPALGLRTTQLVAVALNLFAGCGAFWLARRAAAPAPTARAAAPALRLDATVGFASLALALGGFAAMALQIVWFRFLIALYGPIRPVFSLLLTVILVGIWLGALLGAALATRLGRPGPLYAAALAGFGITAAAAFAFPPADAAARYAALLAAAGGPWPLYRTVLVGALSMVGVPALLAGVAFPLANALVQDRSDVVGTRAGLLYLGNTTGSVLGSLIGGFVLLPRLGMQNTTAVVLAVLVAALGALALAARPRRRSERVAFVVCAAALLGACAAWQRLPETALLDHHLARSQISGAKVIAVREGVNETIAVLDHPLGRRLVTNGYGMSGTTFLAQRYMRAFVHVPMLLTDRIENVMVMCFGVGNTANAALADPNVRRVDVVDLSHDVLGVARHFENANPGTLSDPRVTVHVNDARHHLRMLAGPTYDLITGEPPPLPVVGVVSLYTREFFELVRSRLRPGGITTYWLPALQIGEGSVRSVVRAFLDVFPDAVLLNGHTQQLILVGRKDAPLALDPAAARARMHAAPQRLRDLRRIGLERLVEWVGLLAATPATLARATRDAPALVDDRPMLEYQSRELVWDRQLPADLFSVEDYTAWCPRCAELPADERDEIAGYLEVVGAYYRSRAFLRAQPGWMPPFDPHLSQRALRAVSRSLYLQDLVGRLPDLERRALAAAQHGRNEEAIELLGRLARERPGNLRVQLDFATLLAEAGRSEEAARQLAAARALAPADPLWRDVDAPAPAP